MINYRLRILKDGNLVQDFITIGVDENVFIDTSDLIKFKDTYSSYLTNRVSLIQDATKYDALEAIHLTKTISIFVDEFINYDFEIKKLEGVNI